MMKISLYLFVVTLGLFFLYGSFAGSSSEEKMPTGNADSLETAIFAGGCFWCMEKPFEELPGVHSVVSGYTGGSSANPTYQTYMEAGHIEVVKITYDPTIVSYERLLEVFWMQINPTDPGGQFVDRGHAYSTAIFYINESQKKEARRSKTELEARKIFSKPIVTPVLAVKPFYPAEEYHQDYYKENPIRYKYYRKGSGRDKYLDRIWDNARKLGKKELRKKLTALQYEVTQKDGTEPPFKNEYWDNKKAGIYVDIVSGEPLFSSQDKYKSGTGWPSFSRPLVPENVVTKEDRSLFFSVRTEVRSKKGNSHLGHVFDDGPAPTGKRYCMNSASLRFIPEENLEAEGYGKFLPLFH